MKKFQPQFHSIFTFALLATGLISSTLAVAAPTKVQRNAAPVKPMKKSIPAPVVAPSQGTASAVAGQPGFTPSRFGGVIVRHVPHSTPSRTVQSLGQPRKHGGIKIGKERRAPDPHNGIMADVDPNSFPDEVVVIAPMKAKATAHKPAPRKPAILKPAPKN